MNLKQIKVKLGEFPELLKLEHSLFALPFAFMGVFMAAGGWPDLGTSLLVILCMVAARTAGMSFNRVFDAEIDRKNPRTEHRAVAEGRISGLSVLCLAFFCLFVLSLGAYFLNPLAFYLSFLCHLLLILYSFIKRISWACHFFLGLVEAFAPLGGWIAVKGSLDHFTPYCLGAATIFWIAGMDIVYATQDLEVDKKEGLHSLPSRLGLAKSLFCARLSHSLTLLLLWLAGFFYQAGWLYDSGLVMVALLFIYQHSLVSVDDQKKLNLAFFGVNSWIAFIMMLTSLVETMQISKLL